MRSEHLPYDDRGRPDWGVSGIVFDSGVSVRDAFRRAVLTAYVRAHGPIPCARVSSGIGIADLTRYFGVMRCEIGLRSQDAKLTVAPCERPRYVGSDRMAEQECEALCEREQRVMIDVVGFLADDDVRHVLSRLGAMGRFGQHQGGVK